MMDAWWAKLDNDGTITFSGIDFSNRRPLRVVERAGKILAVKHSGGSCWAGVNMGRSVVPAQFMVFRIIEDQGQGHLKLERLIDIPIREKKP